MRVRSSRDHGPRRAPLLSADHARAGVGRRRAAPRGAGREHRPFPRRPRPPARARHVGAHGSRRERRAQTERNRERRAAHFIACAGRGGRRVGPRARIRPVAPTAHRPLRVQGRENHPDRPYRHDRAAPRGERPALDPRRGSLRAARGGLVPQRRQNGAARRRLSDQERTKRRRVRARRGRDGAAPGDAPPRRRARRDRARGHLRRGVRRRAGDRRFGEAEHGGRPLPGAPRARRAAPARRVGDLRSERGELSLLRMGRGHGEARRGARRREAARSPGLVLRRYRGSDGRSDGGRRRRGVPARLCSASEAVLWSSGAGAARAAARVQGAG